MREFTQLLVARSENPEDWAPLFAKAIWQASYRQLGMVALPCDIKVASGAIDILCKQGLGGWHWLLRNRVLVWEEVPIDHAFKVHLYVFGSPTRGKNTVLVRQGFWRMYFFELGLRLLDVSIIGRILAGIK
jgi:hypothetical protein